MVYPHYQAPFTSTLFFPSSSFFKVNESAFTHSARTSVNALNDVPSRAVKNRFAANFHLTSYSFIPFVRFHATHLRLGCFLKHTQTHACTVTICLFCIVAILSLCFDSCHSAVCLCNVSSTSPFGS